MPIHSRYGFGSVCGVCCAFFFFFLSTDYCILLVTVGNKFLKKIHFFFFFLNEKKNEWCRILPLEKNERWNHNDGFLICDSEAVTLVTVCIIFRRGKRADYSNLEHIPPYLLILKEIAHPLCAKCGFWQGKPHGRTETAAGLCGMGHGAVGLCFGLRFPRGKPWLAAALERASSGGKEAISFIKNPVAGKRGRVPGGDECLREGYAKKMWLAAEQLASAANSDCLAQEDPNYSTTAVAIIAAAGAAWAIRHWKGPGCGSRLLELLCSVLAAELCKTYQMSGRKKWVIINIRLVQMSLTAYVNNVIAEPGWGCSRGKHWKRSNFP